MNNWSKFVIGAAMAGFLANQAVANEAAPADGKKVEKSAKDKNSCKGNAKGKNGCHGKDGCNGTDGKKGHEGAKHPEEKK